MGQSGIARVAKQMQRDALLNRILTFMQRDAEYRSQVLELAKLLNMSAPTDRQLVRTLLKEGLKDDLKSRLAVAEKAYDLKTSLGLAVAGVVDPTPAMDGLGALHSLGMLVKYGEWEYAIDFPLFLLSTVAYAGDTAAKAPLLARVGARLKGAQNGYGRLKVMFLQRARLLGAICYAGDQANAVRRAFLNRFKNDAGFAAWVEGQLPMLDFATSELDQVVVSLMERYRGQGIARPRAVVDLTRDAKLLRESTLGKAADMSEIRKSVHGPTKYEMAVMSLRIGDMVKGVSALTGAKVSHKLGRYLGSGNATHVFALADDPHSVIRIPFAADFLIKESDDIADGVASTIVRNRLGQARPGGRDPISPGSSASSAVERSRWHSGNTVRMEPRLAGMGQNRVAIEDYGRNHEFIIATRVNVVEDGTEFIRRVIDKKLDKQTALQLDQLRALVEQVKTLREAPNAAIAQAMAKALGNRADATLIHRVVDGAKEEVMELAVWARQFGWDGKKWVLLDWE